MDIPVDLYSAPSFQAIITSCPVYSEVKRRSIFPAQISLETKSVA